MNAGVRKCGCDCASADQGQLQLMFAVAAVSSGPLRPIPADIYGKFDSQPRCARAWLNAESMIVVDLRKKTMAGHFPTDFSFVVYRPSQRKTEFSRV